MESGESMVTDEKRLAILEAAQEVRRDGAAVSPAVLGFDDGFLNQGSLLHNLLLRDQADLRTSWATRPGPVKSLDGGTDLFRDAVDSALRATRDAFFDGGDTANFSLGGVDVSVTLRGDRRMVSVNGYDILGTSQYIVQGSDVVLPEVTTGSRTVNSREMAVAQDDSGHDGKITLADVRRFVFHPRTIVAMLAFLGFSLVLAMASSKARRD
jgi:hypothetical protein